MLQVFDIHCAVYVPYGPQAAVHPFRMRKDESVEDLAKSIREHPNFKPHLEDKALSLFKVLTINRLLLFRHADKQHPRAVRDNLHGFRDSL